MTPLRQLRPLIRVALPVAVAAALVCMAIVNIALVKAWVGELDDGVLWARGGDNVVVADDIAPGFAGDRAGVRLGDTLESIDGHDVHAVSDVATTLHAADGTQGLLYVVKRAGTELNLLVQLQPMPTVNGTLYYSLALVGILVDRGRRVGAAAAAERSGDAALLLADGRVLRRARVHAGGPLRPPRLLLRMGGRGRAARAAAALPPLRVRVSGAAESVGRRPIWAAPSCRCCTCRRSCSAWAA